MKKNRKVHEIATIGVSQLNIAKKETVEIPVKPLKIKSKKKTVELEVKER